VVVDAQRSESGEDQQQSAECQRIDAVTPEQRAYQDAE
jgi:hypothetical protein